MQNASKAQRNHQYNNRNYETDTYRIFYGNQHIQQARIGTGEKTRNSKQAMK